MTEAAAGGGAADPAGRRNESFCARLRGLGGTRAGLILAFGSGALAALALPPLYILPVLFLAVPMLVWLIGGTPGPARAGFSGFAFGFGHHLVGLYWISHALLIDPWRHGWLIPLFVGGLAVILALFIGLAAAAARWLAGRRSFAILLSLAAFWVVGEWLRSWVFTGFSWNLLGSAWLFSDRILQVAALTGTWGLSLLALLVFGGLAVAADAVADRRIRLLALPICFAIVAFCFLYGSDRLASAGSEMVEGARLRLVQPNIPQSTKWSADLARDHLLKLMRMSLGGDGAGTVTHVIWPETAVPFALERHPGLADALARAVPPGGLLITGIPRVTQSAGDEAWHNGMVALDSSGMVRASFDKFHLVPFGEYVPVRWIPGVNRIAPGESDFTPGPGPVTVDLPGLPPVSPLICYEVIFPGAVTNPDRRPEWLLNLTNDAWFGLSTGPYQHFASARLRAVEEGLPMVRVANTGISGVVDPYGRVLAELELGSEGVIDTSLPRALTPTPYARFGDGVAGFLSLLLLAIGFAGRRL
ncbi:MAG TPA: apolipoprotein N-acyltransferase [Alphaproteobacteria bacterium]|nr:apolipoprotein N-acyltransferase [Alphaproteobacteria bacterium]